jgi:hypothetical protein
LKWLVRKSIASQEQAIVQMQQLQLTLHYRQLYTAGETLPSYRDVGFRLFSGEEEDGILLYLLAIVGSGEKHLVDIGALAISGSTTANLIVNHGWTGVLIEGNPEALAAAREEYAAHGVPTPTLLNAWIDADNVDALIKEHCSAVDRH